jgi:glycosyltransferase involved in cell wall biosynthesis
MVGVGRRTLHDFAGTGRRLFRRQTRELGLDLIHFPGDRISPHRPGLPTVVTFWGGNYWVLPRHRFWHRNRLFRRLAQANIALSLREADAVVVASSFLRHILVELVGIEPAKVFVSPQPGFVKSMASEVSAAGVDRVRTAYGLERPYFFFPSSGFPYKNHARLIHALRLLESSYQLQADLLLTCPETPELRGVINRHDLDERVRFLGYVAQEDLPQLYAAAAALVHPTLYEAAGSFSTMEAMFCGCPVLCSRLGPMLELVEGAGLYFDPYSAEEMALRMYQILSDEELRQRLTASAQERARTFELQDSIDGCVRAYAFATQSHPGRD